MEELAEKLIREGALATPRIIRAFRAIDRKNFVPAEYAAEAYEDYPLPIGAEQTISQPTTVAFMLELLAPRPGDRALDVGAGSGWTTALLAEIVGPRGSVVGVERIPELAARGSANLAGYGFPNARIVRAGKVLGFPAAAPYDRILVSAEAGSVPETLADQLAEGGVMAIPVRGAIVKATKRRGKLAFEPHEGFAFVPLIEEKESPGAPRRGQ